MENLSEGHCCCDGGKTKSTPSLGFRLRLEFDKKLFEMYFVVLSRISKLLIVMKEG